MHFDRLNPCPKGLRFDDVDSNDINRQEPEPNATQEHSRGPRLEDEREEPAVHRDSRDTEQQPIKAPTHT